MSKTNGPEVGEFTVAQVPTFLQVAVALSQQQPGRPDVQTLEELPNVEHWDENRPFHEIEFIQQHSFRSSYKCLRRSPSSTRAGRSCRARMNQTTNTGVRQIIKPSECTAAHVPTSIQVPVGVFQQQPALVEQSGKVPNVEH